MMMMMTTTTWTLWPLMVLIATTAQQHFRRFCYWFSPFPLKWAWAFENVRGGSDLFGLWKWQTGQQNVSIIGNLGSN